MSQIFSFYHNLSIHDLTRRSTPTPEFRLLLLLSFNSRPHKEVDTPCGQGIS